MKVFLLGILLILCTVLGFYESRRRLEAWGVEEMELAEPVQVKLERGTSLSVFSKQLYEAKLVSHPNLFQWWVKFHADYSKFQAGPYRFEGIVSPLKISEIISKGEIHQPVVLEFTIPEGFTLDKTIKRLAALNVESEAVFRKICSDQSFIRSLGVEAQSLEGYLYPAKYIFTTFPTPEEAISKPVQTFFERLPEDYQAKVQAKGLTLNDAVTFASLIELETKFEEEMLLVSEVIWNRLNRQMTLGIDAAVIYGIDDYRGNLTKKHLEDASNPYNTRIHSGLPPTPIGSPSTPALLAVLTPSDFGYLYYVTDIGSGYRHSFSKTLSEHNEKVQKLIRDYRELKRSGAFASE